MDKRRRQVSRKQVLEAHRRDVQLHHDERLHSTAFMFAEAKENQQTEAPFIRVENNEKKKRNRVDLEWSRNLIM
jgi:hypothetical protein